MRRLRVGEWLGRWGATFAFAALVVFGSSWFACSRALDTFGSSCPSKAERDMSAGRAALDEFGGDWIGARPPRLDEIVTTPTTARAADRR